MIRFVPAVLCLAALAACSLDPVYIRPAPEIPPSWPIGDAYLKASEAALPSVRYQNIFSDPKLRVIIARALAHNQNLQAALANIASARGLYRVQRSELLPRLDGSGGVGLRGNGAGGRTATTGTSIEGGSDSIASYNAQIGISAFEIDLFGRVRSLTRSALQQYLATEAAARSVRLSLVGQVANAYLTLAADRSFLAITIDTETSAAKSVELTRARLLGGIAPRSDLRLAQTILAQAQSDHANQITLVAQDSNLLELLVGAPVADAELPASIESVDGMLRELPAGLDSRVLLRRPDVVQAEYLLRAANARIGAARASFFPSISLTSFAGFASTALTSLFTGGAFNWSVAPSFSLPIFDGGANRGNLAYARAQNDLYIAQYRSTIQTAFREVADALARRGTIDRQLAAQTELEAAARDNLGLEDARYRGGIDPYLTLLISQRTFYSARLSLASTRLLRASNLVALYQTLGSDSGLDTPALDTPAHDTTAER